MAYTFEASYSTMVTWVSKKNQVSIHQNSRNSNLWLQDELYAVSSNSLNFLSMSNRPNCWIMISCELLPLREKLECPKLEFSSACIFPYSDCTRRFTLKIFVFSPNTGKYGPEKTPKLDAFWVESLLSYNLLLQMHGARCNMGNIFQISYILQLISWTFRQVK